MLTFAIVAVLATMVLALIRNLFGPTEYDRMLAANSFGTKTVLLIALGGYALSWNSFLDVALLYALLNFVGTIAAMRFFEYGRSSDESEESEESEGPGEPGDRQNLNPQNVDPQNLSRSESSL